MSLTRREFLAALGAGVAAVGADAYLIEPQRLALTRHVLNPEAPASGPLLRLVQLTDLHLRDLRPHEERIAEAVAGLDPDLVVLTGDSIDRADRLPQLASFLDLLSPHRPGYAVLGNWERWSKVGVHRLRDTYARCGIRLLVNESVIHRQGDAAVLITGLDDLVGGVPDLGAALRDATPCPWQILLAHCPAQRDRLREAAAPVWYRPSHMLAGHTHGGQVTVFGLPPFLPRGSGRYLKGWYRDPGQPALYVSRGLGTSGLPLRLWATPEIAAFELRLGPPDTVQGPPA